MSCIYKITEDMSSYTATEKKLADYILQHRQETTLSATKELAAHAGVSPSAVVRFTQRLGYSGFVAFKVDLASDSVDDIANFDDILLEEDSISDVVRKSKSLNTRLQEESYRLLNIDSLTKAVEAIQHCQKVYLYGISASGIVCMDLWEKLSRINRQTIYHQDFHDQLAATTHIGPADVALAVSYSGKTHEVNAAMRYAKEQGAVTVAVTQFEKSPLTRFSDILLRIPSTEREIRLGAIASRNASLIVTDLLYMCLAKNDLEKTKEYLIKTKEAIQRLY
ncbi:MurR/RpiR family transcriptional regulator [Bifidobacterium aquikefiri]|uniref:MurR/RpiR family transcriptional regulator n=1 Tax=Bifidobacterium aquikefiri TaxID=1653207 RepID=UPI0023F4CE81|nr:MurR/RpiR family transcriptional regulator [Bifidobacterium aquikefiri]